ncbi:Mechanosensitive ion channel protein 6 [Citrus sinensis]|nr:Mechanosensitive ion channel protein 6 [Citrus sinensis]
MTKTKSRLMDLPPERIEPKSGRVVGRSGQLKSGFIGKNVDEEEEDPLLEEDLPEEYKKEKISIWVLLEWFSLILIIGALVCSLTIDYFKKKKLWKLGLWKWELLILVLICGRLVSSWIVRIIVFCIERNFLLRKRVLYFVYGVRKAVQNCLWLGLVLIAWHCLFDQRVERETNSKVLKYATKILICLWVGVMLWLVKTLLVKVLASSFHVSTYFDRIQEALFNQYLIETLSGPPLIEIQKAEEEQERIVSEVQKLQNAGVTIPPGLKSSVLSSPQSAKVIGSGRLQRTPREGKSPKLSHTFSNKDDDGITIDHLHKLNPKNVSAWNMKRLMNIIRHGSLTTLDEQIQDSTNEDESAPHIKTEYEAKAAARKIFQNVAKPGSKFIYLEDLMRFLNEDEASKTMSLFEEASERKKISKSALKNWVVNVFRERRALAFTLNDTKTAVNKLHRFVNVLIGIITVIIWLLILGIATTKFLLFISSQVVVVAFVFGNTCKTVFEAIIFLFVMHPFDVGDRCEIDGVQMVVEEMNILSTVFLRYDNQKIIFPNSVLATKAIGNYYRSPDMGDAVEFCIHISTPAEKIAQMKQRILSFIENKKDHWCTNPMFIFKDVEELNRVRFAIWLSHKMNHQDIGERWERRALLVEEMTKIFRELDIQYRLWPIDINVRAMPGPPMASDRLS